MHGFNDDRSKADLSVATSSTDGLMSSTDKQKVDVIPTKWKNGSQTGSVRTSASKEEDTHYIIGTYAVAEGYMTRASGSGAHAEGRNTTASGGFSHAEGEGVEASGNWSHGEGRNSIASGSNAHAEGYNNTASGGAAHAEGSDVIAGGSLAHAEGLYTIASGNNSHVQGKYNIEDPSAYTKTTDTSVVSGKKYYTLSNGKFSEVSSPTTSELSNYYVYTPTVANQAFIIGNGVSDSSRSNALTVDWDGNLDIAGNLQIEDSAWINKVVDSDSTVAPSSDKWKAAIHIKDKNDLSLGYLEGAVLSNGNNGMTLTARRDISGTNYYNGVRLLVDSSGNPVTQFNSPKAWREGLGLSLSSSQNIASYISSSKGTFVSGQIVTYDRIAQLIIRFRNTSAVASGANIYEGTLTKWHPVSLNGSGVNGIGYFGASALVGYINSSGGIIVRNASNSSVTINSSSNAYVTFTYLMGANQ